MDKYELFNEKLKNRGKVVGPCIQCANPILIEKMAEQVDFFVLDGEHGVFNNENLVNTLLITRLKNTPTIVRVADCRYDLISRALYMGADGIMIPRCETLEQVKVAVESMNFAPIGKLGCGGHGQFRAGESVLNFKRHLVLQIESPKGTENLPEILEEYGEYISAIVIGPYDYSIMLGKPQEFDNPELIKHIQKIFDICRDNNTSAGIFVDNIEKAEKYIGMGANFIWAGTDVNMFINGFNNLYDLIKED